jgi:tripartite-type tricarboxylate transporter receptor subunit TctC
MALVAASLAPNVTYAQGRYPERAIRIVVPFAAGGGGDLVARKIAQRAAPVLGQTLVVENIAGAGGAIGAANVARSNPDGYTLFLAATSTHAINPAIMHKLPYDPIKDFAPVAMVANIPTALGMHPSVPAKDLSELIRMVRARPGGFSYSSTGSGSINHLAGEFFKKQAGGLEMIHIPYRGTAQSVTEVMAGQVPLVVATLSAMLPHYRSGRLRIPALFNDRRLKIASEIPTAIEQGVAGMSAYTFNAICAPAGTAPRIIDQLARAIAMVMSDAAFQKELEDLAIDPVTDSGPADAARVIAQEIAKWSSVARASKLKAD